MAASLKEKVEIAHSLLTSVAILVGGLWAAGQYLEKKHQDRIGKSFEVVAKFRESEDVRHYGEFADSSAVNAVLHDTSLKGAEKSAQIAKLHTKELHGRLRRAIELYEDAVVCVKVDHCDRDVIAAFMAWEANATYVIGYGAIDEARRQHGDATYASELIEVRGWYCALPEAVGHRLKSASWCR